MQIFWLIIVFGWMKQVWMITQTNVPWVGLRWVGHVFAMLPLSVVSGFQSLPALTCEGMIALDIFEGSVNKERFLTFLNEQVVRLASLLNCHQLHN